MPPKLIVAIIAVVVLITGYTIYEATHPSTDTSGTAPSLTADTLSNDTQWHNFTSPSGKFKAFFPARPQHATDTLNDTNHPGPRYYDMYVAEKSDGTMFMISSITFLDKDAPAPDKSFLSQLMDDMVKTNENNQLKKSEEVDYLGHPALNFTIESNQVTVDGRAFIQDKTLYLLSMVAKNPDYSKKDFDFFVKSFELLPDMSSPVQDIPTPATITPQIQ